MSSPFPKTSLEDRVAIFLQANPDAEYIPLHPNDYNALYETENLGAFDRPVKCLGNIGHRNKVEDEEVS